MTLVAAAPAAGTVVTGVLGFLVVAGMGLALFFLLRSMNKQLRKVVPDPAWRKEISQDQAKAQDQDQAKAQEEQDYTTNGTAQR